MKHRTDLGEKVRDLIEAAFEKTASAGAQPAPIAGAPAVGTVSAPEALSVGEVRDTHHPHLPGRVCVRFLDGTNGEVERWLQRERHLSLRTGDRVLLALAAGHPERIVIGALGREAREPEREIEDERELRMRPGESVRVVSHEGRTLLTLRQGAAGPEIELGEGNVELKAARTLRIAADTIELAAAGGGIDLRTDGDTVVRARTIRLN